MRGVYYSACSLCYKTIGVTKNIRLLLRDGLLFRRLLLPESTVITNAPFYALLHLAAYLNPAQKLYVQWVEIIPGKNNRNNILLRIYPFQIFLSIWQMRLQLKLGQVGSTLTARLSQRVYCLGRISITMQWEEQYEQHQHFIFIMPQKMICYYLGPQVTYFNVANS